MHPRSRRAPGAPAVACLLQATNWSLQLRMFLGVERIAGHQHRQGNVPVIQQYWLMWPAELCGFKRVWLQAISSAWI